ncbi:hypothetical protein AMS68_007829 [Peltaster fructicola]|uniref:USP domain-containing protein n=1 Tax=Peltaster fructicola TaxID=286661 RepID=A0A6H0Y5J2_9PEZI|nr:hypothetical protein AMS68_007829 [Peltaster fructicola]
MSAAALPPPNIPSAPPSSNGGFAAKERVFAHIQDLQAQALTGYNSSSSIKVLTDIADRCLATANSQISFRRPDLAFVEYMRAHELATNVIPRHTGYIDLIHDDKNGEHRLKVLNRKLFAQHEQYMNIKSIIESDNLRNGVQRNSVPSSLLPGRNSIDMSRRDGAQSQSNGTPAHMNGVMKPPKPQALHGRPLSEQPQQDLTNRFNRLRLSTVTSPTSEPDSALSYSETPIDMAPHRPAKLPLDLPKPPSPTYSPARNMDTNGGFAPPRHTARSLASSRTEAILGSAPRRKRSTHHDDLRIDAERLYDYLQRFSVLLIDVRARADFDQGHIFTRNIMCIEPMTLRHGMSAEEVYETLVLSPDREQLLWDDRHMFDLIVYYDQAGGEQKYLHDALWEFNQEKPLKAAPKLLIGGLDAWCDIAGSQSLASSTTIRRLPQRRPAGRSDLRVPKRRLRDYNPLDQEEERSWLERARQESLSAPKPPILDDGNSVIEEFLQRFPEVEPPKIPSKIVEYPRAPQPPARPSPAAPRMSYNGVSDRAVPPPLRTASLAPYVPPKYASANLRLPKTGLVNFGVTCYMNATLQALSATVPLSVFFLDDQFRKSVQRDNWKGSKGVMPELYSTLIRSLWAGDVESIKPTTFRNFCGRLNREWTLDRQQDAKEFFDFLVDCLHEDLNGNWSRQPAKALTEAEEQRREAMPKGVVSRFEWDRYLYREESYLTRLFAGQHASRLKCTTCGFTSTTYEAFYSLSVEVKPTLDECLRSYCAEEMLSGDEVWKCVRCRREREATKQIILTRAPQNLVVHFKRFASTGSSTRKVRTPIDFPLTGLDLEPYMLPPTPPELFEKYSVRPEMNSAPYLYDAYAVIRHIGTTLTSGHYICASKDRVRGTWRMFNDTRVGDFQPSDLGRNAALNNEEAYIVFYSRRVS